MHWLFWWRPPCLLQGCIVNLKTDGVAIRGVLWAARGPWLTLKDGALIKAEAGAVPIPIDHEVIVHRSNISFIQVLP
jgi:hypothetical protein